MNPEAQFGSTANAPALQVYLLGAVEFEAALALQRRLVYEVSCDRTSAALIVCEHPPLITVGRQGSRAHVRFEPEELAYRGWPVRWVNRGGGSLLHLPGQLAVYPILPLDRLGLGLQPYLARLHQAVCAVLEEYGVRGGWRPGRADVWAGARPVAAVGVAVRDWVSYYGAVLNVNPDLHWFRRVYLDGTPAGVMTSLERERRGPVRVAHVRERLVEQLAARFGFRRVTPFSEHPALARKAPADAVVTRS
jgi:lipoyl(octanoyl) transferase